MGEKGLSNYRFTTKEYNLEKYIIANDLIEEIIRILEGKLDINITIDMVNTLADFIQFNKQYSHMKSFNQLVDLIVNIIEEFNLLPNNKEIDVIDISIRLKALLCDLKKEIIENTGINIFFYGKDKYNIRDESFNENIKIIDDIKNYQIFNEKNNELNIDIIVVSEETKTDNLDYSLYFDEIIYYDKLMNYMFNISEKIYYNNYDYNYLLKSLERASTKDIEAIVVGNSYPLTGIDVKLFDNKTISLALSSQDLYYSYKLAELSINNNNNIKRCIIGAGYYLVNHDLSKSNNEDAINRVKNVYYPILGDKHNSENVDSIEILNINKVLNDNVINYIFNLDFLDSYFKDLIYRDNNGYFNSNFTRESNSMLRGIKLSEIKEDDKWKLGENRANQHNKLSKYTKTTKEYNEIFNEFIDFLIKKNVEPIVVVFPNTKYYRTFLDSNYEKEFYNIVENIKQRDKIRIIDFSKKDIFTEDDFIDFDHMSEIGALRITNEINKNIY